MPATAFFYGKGAPQDYNQAFRWFLKAATQGDLNGEFWAGVSYDSGNGVQQDHKQAFQWYEKTALRGHAGAEYNLAELYSHGAGVAQDRKQALAYYLKAAQHGTTPYTLVRAQRRLGECFERGWGTAVDLRAARSW